MPCSIDSTAPHVILEMKKDHAGTQAHGSELKTGDRSPDLGTGHGVMSQLLRGQMVSGVRSATHKPKLPTMDSLPVQKMLVERVQGT